MAIFFFFYFCSKPDSNSAPEIESTHSVYQVSKIGTDTYLAGCREDGGKPGTLISDNTEVLLQSLYPVPKEDSNSSPPTSHQTPQDTDNHSPNTDGGNTSSLDTVKNVTSNGDLDNSDFHKSVAKFDVEEHSAGSDGPSKGKQITKLESWYLLGLLVWINALQTSFVLAIQVYSSLPYGLQFYHGATKVSSL